MQDLGYGLPRNPNARTSENSVTPTLRESLHRPAPMGQVHCWALPFLCTDKRTRRTVHKTGAVRGVPGASGRGRAEAAQGRGSESAAVSIIKAGTPKSPGPSFAGVVLIHYRVSLEVAIHTARTVARRVVGVVHDAVYHGY